MPRATYRIFDCDVHHHFPSNASIAPYLPGGKTTSYYTGGRGIPHPDGPFRLDAVTPDGGVPASDPGFVVTDLLDRYGIEHAILNCGSVLELSTMHDIDRAVELARAINDWTIEEWFPADERFLGSITVATSDPLEAAAEIRRLGSHPRMVQAVATGMPCFMGNPFLHPIYEACVEVGLPFTYHQGGHKPTPGATPTSFVESHTYMCVPALPNVVSLVTEGVFVKYPELTVVFNEFGVAWIPFIMWRLDMEYRAGRDELPWLTRLPSEYITDHLRFTTQPLEEPANPKHLASLLATFDAEHMLMFSTDYPHWDADNPVTALRAIPDEWKERIFFENASETFKVDRMVAA
jgi:predicted TIM-barrel fold metal-dependent hydrolase